ncbi:hypothetical protein MSG28_005770 [Choristoneura fumiferana]|uniref:Uncharacterized protein n=1 Tax=Choristoneura fumiferana TaxID=7141 RepID=A0ACC0L077_CHOFU|nr:hypothetical protein MSG28_005770 [Choristoneura fumiferana]
MEESYSGSDVSLSPSQILERLHVLRQLQLMQQGKLQKQRLQYQESPQSSTLTEIVSQFSQSTSFNTFRSLLENPGDSSNDATPRYTSNKSPQVKPNDLIDGVSVLNLSQESEFILQSPLSIRSKASVSSKQPSQNISGNSAESQSLPIKKQISLDDMPILSPKKDFEALIIEKMKNEMNAPKSKILQRENDLPNKGKQPFLRRGEGMARFGLKKNDIVIQNTHSLPWKQNSSKKLALQKNLPKISKKKNVEVQIVVDGPKSPINAKENSQKAGETSKLSPNIKVVSKNTTQESNSKQSTVPSVDSSTCEVHVSKPTFPLIQKEVRIQPPKGKHPLLGNKGKTWAAVLTKEQDDFLRQLKQSDYYKNFTSPAKSVISDISCDENLMRLKQDREIAEQNMFELLENKVDRESFDIDNSFIGRFLNRNMKGLKSSDLECSGESTPLIMQKCLANNPKLMSIFPNMHRTRNENSQSEADTCNSDYTECCNETCTSASSCCSCNTVEETNSSDQVNRKNRQKNADQHDKPRKLSKEAEKQPQNEPCQNDNDNDILKAEMAEMNAKLIATSDLLKDRLKELEDEIETFRKENSNLTKMREEIECEKHKFYEEKSAFEQKFNEEKILSEYYLAEEKDKLNKQKQIYERQVREMRGRLNKKEKDEVINLKKEISDLKEEIRLKDAKSTTTVARLRNQLKIIEKEKKELQDEVEKLKKENRRIQHSNDITRRMSNIKYLEEINKKLTNMKTNNTQSHVELDPDVKYKAFEIERQSRSRRVQHAVKNPIRARAKSVPNLNVTSRYAKYFSQRDVVSPTERNQTLNVETYPYEEPDRDLSDNEIESLKDIESISSRDMSDNEGENSLEKIYMERFQEHSKHSDQSNIANRSKSSQSSCQYSYEKSTSENTDAFFIRRSNSTSSSARNSKSPNQSYQPSGSNVNRSKSPVSILSHRSSSGRQSPINVTRESQKPDYLSSYSRSNSQCKSKSPVSNHTYSSQQQPTVINRDQYDNRLAVSPEPAVSKSSLTKTELKPTELRKPDGSRELRFPNGNIKYLSADGKYSKFVYYNGDIKENFYNEGRIKYYYAETKTCHTTHPDGLEVLEFSDGQVEKRYKDGSSEIRLPNGSVRYFDPKNEHVREEWRFPDGATLTVAASGDRRVVFANGQVEVHTRDHKRREFPDGTVKLLYNDGTSETRYASGRVRIKDKHGNLIMDSVPG